MLFDIVDSIGSNTSTIIFHTLLLSKYRNPLAPLSGLEHDDADGAAFVSGVLEHLDQSPLWSVESEGDVVAAIFGLDAHVAPSPIEEVVPASEHLEYFQCLLTADARLPGIICHAAENGHLAGTIVVEHGVGNIE